jgi:effector-binding domain-containing protein
MQEALTGEIALKDVSDVLISSIRIFGQEEDISRAYDQLQAAVGQHTAGSPIYLFNWGHPGPALDVELCIPVSKPISAGAVQSRILEGRRMLTIQHRGSYEQIPESWGKLSGYMRQHRIGWGNGPGREVYLEGPEVHGKAKERYLTEIQVPWLLPEWIGRLEKGIALHAGAETASSVVTGGSQLAPDAHPHERAYWVQGMLSRLEAALPDSVQQHAVLAGCSHIFPERRVEQLRRMFQETGDLNTLLTFMNADRTENGRCYYESPVLEGSTIRVIKIPFDDQGYTAAQTLLEKQMAYCHCPMVKDALQEDIRLSPVYCACGAGWYQTLWEGILQRPARVETLRSLLTGDDACEFAIHLD